MCLFIVGSNARLLLVTLINRRDAYSECTDKESCLSSGECSDWEFGDSFSNGACVYVPNAPYQCYKDSVTQGGWCISNSITNSTLCKQEGLKWITRAETPDQCDLIQQSCYISELGEVLMNKTDCLKCGGQSYAVYSWTYPEWKTGTWKQGLES